MTYTIHCLECRRTGRDVEYVGETSRTTFERGIEHLNDLENEVSGKPLWEHVKEDHGGRVDRSWFKMSMVMKHQTALQRQIREALAIEGSKADVVLNKKGEWNGSRIPSLRVEIADKIEQEEGSREGGRPE